MIDKKLLLESWRDDVCKHSDVIDPEGKYCWESLFVGFALGKGASIKQATDFKLYIDEAYPYEGDPTL